MNLKDLTDTQYALLFGVRRSMRYHDRRRAFFERLHRVTNVLTILMAGSVLHEIGQDGDPAWWLVLLSALGALLAAVDMVAGYSSRAMLHGELKSRFAALEIAMLADRNDEAAWKVHALERLAIEQDEPPVYRALDLLCHNELLVAEGITREKNPEQYAALTPWQRTSSQILQWPDLAAG